MLRQVSLTLVAGLFLTSLPASAAEPLATPRPLPRQFQSLVLPEVRFRDADLIGALRYLQQKAQQQSRGTLQVPIFVDLPADYQPRYELTLELKAVPLAEALRYLGSQAGVEFSAEAGTVIVRRLGAASEAQAASRQERSAPATNTPPRGLTGRLGRPAEILTGGNYIHRSTAGVVQPEKSGYVPHRSMGGWTVNLDPRNRTGVNCVHPEVCPTGACGCSLCACKLRKDPPPQP